MWAAIKTRRVRIIVTACLIAAVLVVVVVATLQRQRAQEDAAQNTPAPSSNQSTEPAPNTTPVTPSPQAETTPSNQPPSTPYTTAPSTPSQPNNPPATPTPVNVMAIDNTVVNWSHEYPAAFVRDYNGWWNISAGKLYLTFDCGYDYNNLAATILDTLHSKGVKAVFFVTGQFMNQRPDLVLRMVNEGHIVGNHSYAHLNQPENLVTNTNTVVADIRAWESTYRSITGANPPVLYFRPPSGVISRRSMALMQQLGYKTLLWGAAYKDWDTGAQPTPGTAMALLRQYTSPGDIVLLHGISQTSSNILGQYIDEYRAKGYTFSLP